MANQKISELSQANSVSTTDLIEISQDQGGSYDSKKVIFEDLRQSLGYQNVVTVANSGGDFTSIKVAMDSITDNATDNRYGILIYPGDYSEDNPIAGKNYVSIKCLAMHEVTRMLCQNSDQHGLICGKDIDVYGLQVKDASGTGKAGFVVDGTIEDVDFHDCKIRNCDIGWLIKSTGEGIVIREGAVTGGTITTIVEASNGASVYVSDMYVAPDVTCTNFIKADEANTKIDVSASILQGASTTYGAVASNTGTVQIVGTHMDDMDTGLYIPSTGGTIRGSGIDINNSTSYDILTESADSTLRLSAVNAIGRKISLDPGTNEVISFIDEFEGDEGLTVYGELHVGTPVRPKESVFGGGDSFTNSMMVYEYDDGLTSYTDKSEEAASSSGSSTFTIPGTDVDDAIYLSCDLLNTTATDYIQFYGIKASITTAVTLGGGEIVAEYYNGSWTEFNHMSTESGGDYIPYAEQIFERTGSEQIRFANDILSDWTKNDPITSGTDRYWIRFRVATSITTAPVFEQFKLHTSRFEVNDDGYTEWFGIGRPIGRLPWDYGLTEAAAQSPADQDVYVSDNVFVGRRENNFLSNATDQQGFNSFLPFDADTSIPVVLQAALFSPDTDASNDIRFAIRWGYTSDGDTLYGSTASAPSSGPNEQETEFIYTMPGGASNANQVTGSIELDISDMVSKRTGGSAGDILWVSFERQASHPSDTFGGDIAIVNIAAYYTRWTSGGHL